jgi:hypothetical protein
MAQKTPMNVRIDADLKKFAEEAAEEAGISLTEHVERSLKLAGNPTCARCGRSSDVGVAAAGLSQAFAAFLEELRAMSVNAHFLVLTIEGGARRAYWGRLFDARSQEAGALAMRVCASTRVKAEVPLLVPHGCIVGWRDDADGGWFRRMLQHGYEDGGARVGDAARRPPEDAVAPRGVSREASAAAGARRGARIAGRTPAQRAR